MKLCQRCFPQIDVNTTQVKVRSPEVSSLPSLTLNVCVQISCKGPDEIEDTAVSAVADAIKGSTLVEVSEDGFQIRRRDVRPPSQSAMSMPVLLF